jgi:hypothetical protein
MSFGGRSPNVVRRYDASPNSNLNPITVNFVNSSFVTLEKNKIHVYFGEKHTVICFDSNELAKHEYDEIHKSINDYYSK